MLQDTHSIPRRPRTSERADEYKNSWPLFYVDPSLQNIVADCESRQHGDDTVQREDGERDPCARALYSAVECVYIMYAPQSCMIVESGSNILRRNRTTRPHLRHIAHFRFTGPQVKCKSQPKVA